MRINNNLTAMNAHRQYGINNSKIAKSVEKLSSGYRINRAGDDAAGLAISEKMRAQIRGLTMASKNSQDAISLVQTAEGALQESHNILQRMRELAVQSASDTNETTIDRGALQQEFSALMEELNDISTTTRFNDQNLLDGTFQAVKSTLNNPDTTLANINAISVSRAGGGEYEMTVGTTAANTSAIAPGAQCAVYDDGLDVMATMSDKVSGVTFQGLETSDNNGNVYTLHVTGSDIKNMTFQLKDTNGDIVATAQNVNTSVWQTGANSAANIVSFNGVGTFTFELSEKVTNVSDLTSLSGAEVEFMSTGDAYRHTIALDAAAGADVATAIQTDIAASLAYGSGTVTATYTAGNNLTKTTSSEDAPANYELSYAIGTNGNVEVSVMQGGKKVTSASAKLNGVAAGETLTIDLGDFGSIELETATDPIKFATQSSHKKATAVINGGDVTAAQAAIADLSGDTGTTISGITLTGATDLASYVYSTSDGIAKDFSIAYEVSAAGVMSANLMFGDEVLASGSVDLKGTAGAKAINFGGNLGTFTVTTATQNFTAGTAGSGTIKIDSTENDVIDAVQTSGSEVLTDSTTTAAISVEGGQEQLSSLATRAFMTLTINGESVNLYKGDTYANFSQQGIAFEFDALSDNDIADASYFGGTTVDIAVNETEGKTLIIQSGANQGDELGINIDTINADTLGISYSNISTRETASKAITEVNNAINQVSTQRAALGALQNRLEHKIANLDNSAENLQSAESLIRDVDMAKEMTTFMKNNILAQASTAMLAQANSLPQGVLQLLG